MSDRVDSIKSNSKHNDQHWQWQSYKQTQLFPREYKKTHQQQFAYVNSNNSGQNRTANRESSCSNGIIHTYGFGQRIDANT